MAKKIRFPLEMDNGVEVRSMEELREHFSLAKVLECLENGRLVTWLRDRYANDIADAVEALDQNDPELAKKVSEIFDVPYNEEELEKSKERAQRLKRLKEFTQDEQFLDKIDNVAFDQDELYDLLDEDKESIYLCGDRFTIPLSKAGISYVGINNPTAVIDSKVEVDWEEKKISMEGVTFDEKYQDIVNRANAAREKGERSTREEIGAYSKKTYLYADRKILESMLPPTETESVQKMYDRAKSELENLNYDTDENIVINSHLFEKDDKDDAYDDEDDEYDESDEYDENDKDDGRAEDNEVISHAPISPLGCIVAGVTEALEAKVLEEAKTLEEIKALGAVTGGAMASIMGLSRSSVNDKMSDCKEKK